MTSEMVKTPVDNVEMLLGRVRNLVDCIYDQHTDNTDCGAGLLLSIVQIHSNITTIEGLLDEIRATGETGEIRDLASALASKARPQ